jgi:hypothetical protein
MKQPEDVQLSREEGEALIERIERNALSTEDRQLLVKLLTFYFWLLFALREAKLSLKRLKALVFGEKPKKPKPPTSGGATGGGSSDGQETAAIASPGGSSPATAPPPEKKPPPPGHGRHGAEVYRAAQRVECRHEDLAVGERCPACGRGTLYRLLPGVEMRLDGHALLSAVRYELEKLRCSACGQVFTASVPVGVGAEKYTARARAQAQGKTKAEERTGMQTTALLVQVGERRICLYYTGRRHAGENLAALLAKRALDRGKLLVMSDALSSNNAAEDTLIRCHCLAHGRRKFSELDETFPAESAVVITALSAVFDHEEYTRAEHMTVQDRLTYHQRESGPVMERLQQWLEQQTVERLVEPNSS